MDLRTGATTALMIIGLAGCGTSRPVAPQATSPDPVTGGALPKARPQAIEPAVGRHASAVDPGAPVGDPSAHAPSLAEVRSALHRQLIAAAVTNGPYVDPLPYVTRWERTDQGVDATMPVGAPIRAPSAVKILAIIPDWYAGQPLVYFELLAGPDAGRVQYVAEQITAIARPGSILGQGQAIARFAPSGTAIEYGWSTLDGVTLARATTGYEEGQVTPAGRSIRDWLNRLGANAGAG